MMAHTLSLIITRGSVDLKSHTNVVPIIENELKFPTVQSVDSVEVNSAVFVLLESFQVCRKNSNQSFNASCVHVLLRMYYKEIN